MAGALALALALAAEARAAVVVVTPAAPAAGSQVTVRATQLGPRRPVVVRLGATARLTRTNAQGSVTLRVRVPSLARTGRRTLLVRAGARRIRTTIRVVRGDVTDAALAVTSGGERFVIGTTRNAPGRAFALVGSGVQPRRLVSVSLGGQRVARARADRRGRWRATAVVPARGAGPTSLRLWGRGILVRVRFSVLGAASEPTSGPLVGGGGDPASTTFTIAAAGDVACGPGDGSFNGGAGTPTQCRQAATAGLIDALAPAALLVLGDAQYPAGARADFDQAYAPSWGRHDAIARPVPGDAEYETPGAAGYFSYFGPRAGDPARGYYSYDLGAWHIIALNANCTQVSCAVGSTQERWLRSDLAAHPSACTLAYWHDPRFSSGQAGQATDTDPFWRALFDAGADVVLGGHSHTYERFAPQTPDRIADPAGIRQFVVGTGGEEHEPFSTVRPHSEVRKDDTFGVLALSLRPGGYSWRFVPEPGKTFTDEGSASCH